MAHRAQGSKSDHPRLEELECAIGRAQERLSRLFVQAEGEGAPGKAGGYWIGELEADTTLESDYIIFLYFLDPGANAEKIRKFSRRILRHQLPDGTWNIFHRGPGEISATVKAYLALCLAGYSKDESCLRRAKDAILRLGGAEKVNSFTKFYLALLGQIDWDDVPAIPPEVILLPRFSPINIYEISYWSRAILVPLSILYSKRAVRRPPEGSFIEDLFHDRNSLRKIHGATDNGFSSIAELGDPGSNGGGTVATNGGAARRLNGGHAPEAPSRSPVPPARSAGLAPRSEGPAAAGNGAPPDAAAWRLVSWENFFLMTDRLLKLVEKTPVKPLRRKALKKAEEWMVARFEDSDGLGAIFPSMVNSVMAMRALGYPMDHPHVTEGLEQLRRLEIDEGEAVRLQPCLSPIWDTAKSVNALHESGLPGDHPLFVEAGKWLVAKEVRKPGDWKIRVPHVDVGGWPFQFRNEFYPDVDDTAAVVMALSRIDHGQVQGLKESITRGVHWVTNMQCSCGGWAAFDVDVKREFLTKVPYADHNAMLDPPCADITGRCLEMYARFPELMKDPGIQEVVRRGVEYLKRIQEADGSWYGRWGVNYIYGTWQALKGLCAVGEDPSQSYIRRAVRFLLERQNEDGGWGESCASYEGDPRWRGRGESTASQTAWALMGLIAAGEFSSPAAAQGVRFLLERQGEDGNWEEDLWTGTGFPCVFYLKYHLYRLYFPLFALGMYRSARCGIRRTRANGGRLAAGAVTPGGGPAPRRGLRALFRP